MGRRGREIYLRAVLLACALACAPPASAQLDQWGFWENGVTEAWWLSSAEFAAEDAVGGAARWRSIGEAREREPGGAWDGDYFRGGETHGTYMRWSPRAGFVIAHVNKCEARVTGLTYGRVEASPTLVQFFPEFHKVPAGGHGGHRAAEPAPAVLRFVPVVWRGARLLVAEGEMEDFGDYVAGLGQYNDWAVLRFFGYTTFFQRRGGGAGESGEPAGDAAPVVPHGYERFLKRPVEATITAVGRRASRRDYTVAGPNTAATYARASLTYVTVGAGAAQGVKDRMLLRVASPDEGDTVMILRAGRHASAAVVVRDLDERGAETYFDEQSRKRRHSRVAAGWRLTTSPY